MNYYNLVKLFKKYLNLEIKIDDNLENISKKFIEKNSKEIYSSKKLEEIFYVIICQKLDLYREQKSNFIGQLAKKKIILNYNQKKILANNLNNREKNIFKNINLHKEIIEIPTIKIFSNKEIQSSLKSYLKNPFNKRTKKIDKKLKNTTILAIFSSFIYKSVPKKISDEYFRTQNKIKINKPELTIIDLKDENKPLEKIKKISNNLYERLSNYSTLAIILPLKSRDVYDKAWDVSLDTVLFLEKFKKINFNNSFYKKDIIYKNTKKVINDNNLNIEKFKNFHFGYTYNDTFVCTSKNENHLIIVFKLNKFSDDKLPCPSCLSDQVEHNSYSSLGIKSLECSNLLCPERSLSNRGKRFSYISDFRQNSINKDNKITKELIQKWSRDVVDDVDFNQIFHMLINFHSTKDSKIFYIGERNIDKIKNRLIKKQKLSSYKNVKYQDISKDYFERYLYPVSKVIKKNYKKKTVDNHDFYLGDSCNVLLSFKDKSIDGAITSPPYYNAKQYSQWDNIYTYLYDMKKIINETYRVLKDDSLFLFNIFDYFDNENDIVLSDMGKKRIPLSSLLNSVFKYAGFKFLGNIVWDKGHIEGKRGFNSGNNSPFYQKPFNCWEHIMIYGKNINKKKNYNFPFIFKQTAVHKMIKKKNIIGHTAPYPIELSNLLAKNLDKGNVILDPFGGVFTTAISAKKNNLKSISIEKDKHFFKIGIERFINEFTN